MFEVDILNRLIGLILGSLIATFIIILVAIILLWIMTEELPKILILISFIITNVFWIFALVTLKKSISTDSTGLPKDA